jgi:hypothetical protein
MLQRPKLARTQAIFREKLAITIIQQQKKLGQQAIDILLDTCGVFHFTHGKHPDPAILLRL